MVRGVSLCFGARERQALCAGFGHHQTEPGGAKGSGGQLLDEIEAKAARSEGIARPAAARLRRDATGSDQAPGSGW